MNSSLTVLSCGRNATGLSAVFSVEKAHHAAVESTILSRCFINVGDTTQRFCSENRVKLSRMTCIIVTSLAPHNVSGLPGILLSLSTLGAGKLTIIGPPGLQGLLDSMVVFTNKKYPELQVVEVGQASNSSDHRLVVRVDLEYMTVFVKPVFVSKMPHSSSAVAIAAVVLPVEPGRAQTCRPYASVLVTDPTASLNSSGYSTNTPLSTLSGFAVVPIEREGPGMFATDPSLPSLVAWVASVSPFTPSTSSLSASSADTLPLLSATPTTLSGLVPLILFMPLSVSSIVAPPPTVASKLGVLSRKRNRIIRKCCENQKVVGILFDADLDSSVCELHQAQETLAALGTFCGPLFPVPLEGLKRELVRLRETKQREVDMSVGQGDAVCGDDAMPHRHEDTQSLMRCGGLFAAVPLTRVMLTHSVQSPEVLPVLSELGQCGEGEGGISSGGSSSSSDSSSDSSSSGSNETDSDSESESGGGGTVSGPRTSTTNAISTSTSGSSSSGSSSSGGRLMKTDKSPIISTSSSSSSNSSSNSNSSSSNSSSSSGSSGITSLQCGTRSTPLIRLAAKILCKVDLMRLLDEQEGGGRVGGQGKGPLCPPMPPPRPALPPAPVSLLVHLEGTYSMISSDSTISSAPITVGYYQDRGCSGSGVGAKSSDNLNNPSTDATDLNSGDSGDVSSNTNAASGLRLRLQMQQRSRKRTLPSSTAALDPDLGHSATGMAVVGGSVGCPAVSASSGSGALDDMAGCEQLTVDISKPPTVATAATAAALSSVLGPSYLPLSERPQSIFMLPVPPPGPSDVTVTFLGTGSATPSKHRNNSCVMLSIPIPVPEHVHGSSVCMSHTPHTQQRQDAHVVLLDAGEGTCVQLYQSVGGDLGRFNTVLLSIRCVWISHHHADHICGLPLLLEHVNRALMLKKQSQSSSSSSGGAPYQKIIVIAPPVVLRYYEYCACVSGLDDLVVFVPTVSTLYASYSVPLKDALPLGRGSAGQERDSVRLLLRSVQVPHCRESYAAVLDLTRTQTHQKALRVVYSGDCRPSTALINAGKNCDLLLHEATFDDTMQSDAECKRHCTTSEAVAVGVRMRAKHTVLTHFSQRYPTTAQSFQAPPPGLPQTPQYDPNSLDTLDVSGQPFSVAFDLLHFSYPSQISCLPSSTDVLARAMAAATAAKEAMTAL